ncbi:MAG: hypothetical protein ABI765_01255 [Gemmatimonadota bacterium]
MASLPAPACTSLGSQCQSLKLTLRVAVISGGLDSTDHEATWLLGHTERLSFGPVWNDGRHLYAPVELAIPCKHLRSDASGSRCTTHGFTGDAIPVPVPAQPRQLGGDRFRLMESGLPTDLTCVQPPRSLPVLTDETPEGANPCTGAPCRTADNRQGSACCRDLQVEILCRAGDAELERLIRNRKSPYLCKIDREAPDSLTAELISACGYLESAAGSCTLHGRNRPDGRTAKPDLCFDWPPKGKGVHPGCVFKGEAAASA